MSEAKHTPGPWEAFESRGIGQNRAIGVTPVAVNVCDVAYCDIGNARSDAEKHANARLIAAAPELLEALQALFDAAESGRDMPDAMNGARAAISKATGEGE